MLYLQGNNFVDLLFVRKTGRCHLQEKGLTVFNAGTVNKSKYINTKCDKH